MNLSPNIPLCSNNPQVLHKQRSVVEQVKDRRDVLLDVTTSRVDAGGRQRVGGRGDRGEGRESKNPEDVNYYYNSDIATT